MPMIAIDTIWGAAGADEALSITREAQEAKKAVVEQKNGRTASTKHAGILIRKHDCMVEGRTHYSGAATENGASCRRRKKEKGNT